MDLSKHSTRMDTRARLREQRKKGWLTPAAFLGFGFGVGYLLGLVIHAGTTEGGWPVWGIAVTAYCLGSLTTLFYWWLANLRRKPSPPDHTGQS